MGRKFTPGERERAFWAKIERKGPDDCWPWRAWQDSSGRGRLKVNGRDTGAPCFMWTITHGPIPDGLWVLHSCDNPNCVNPMHLWLGTRRDNIADMDAKNRRVVLRGDDHGSTKVFDSQVAEIRSRYAAGGVTQATLGIEYGISQRTVSDIVTRRRRAAPFS